MGGFTRVFKKAVKVFKKEKPQGIELAKSVDTKVGDVQKDASNNVKGPTTLEVAAQNKRKGRKSTMLTSPTGATQDYTLSKKTLLG
jgi:hypothetical protein|tara:strand:+ start:464 stop:721 length:258 start_codon:yes stop_codon:yes gene_type:complete